MYEVRLEIVDTEYQKKWGISARVDRRTHIVRMLEEMLETARIQLNLED